MLYANTLTTSSVTRLGGGDLDRLLDDDLDPHPYYVQVADAVAVSIEDELGPWLRTPPANPAVIFACTRSRPPPPTPPAPHRKRSLLAEPAAHPTRSRPWICVTLAATLPTDRPPKPRSTHTSPTETHWRPDQSGSAK